MTTNSIGDRLRFLRNRFRLTQGEIADILHVSVSTYRFYENAKREPSISFLILAADYYHVSLDYLYGRTPDDFLFSSRESAHSLF